MLKLEKVSAQVLVAGDSIVRLGATEIEFLKDSLHRDHLDRIRICCHRTANDRLHEMLMAFTKETYVRPSLHQDKDESLLFLEGFATNFFFDDEGNVTDQVPLGPIGSGRSFYCRVQANRYHSLLVESDHVLVKESASGPFLREYTKFPTWAPDGSDPRAVNAYLKSLRSARRHG